MAASRKRSLAEPDTLSFLSVWILTRFPNGAEDLSMLYKFNFSLLKIPSCSTSKLTAISDSPSIAVVYQPARAWTWYP